MRCPAQRTARVAVARLKTIYLTAQVLKDIIMKYQMLQGRRVKYVPGWDCHGLPIELKARIYKPLMMLHERRLKSTARGEHAQRSRGHWPPLDLPQDRNHWIEAASGAYRASL